MTAPDIAVNHHADHPGFAGVTGTFFGLVMLIAGRRNARLAVDVAAVTAADHVVDVGCGPGTAAREAARRGAHVTGVDPSPAMLRVARAFTRRKDSIAWLEGTAESLPLPDGTATVVWSLATVHHWQDVQKGVAEMRRVLAPGGRMLAVERVVRPGATGLASHGWIEPQAQAFAALCRTAGLIDVLVGKQGAGRRAVWTVQGLRP